MFTSRLHYTTFENMLTDSDIDHGDPETLLRLDMLRNQKKTVTQMRFLHLFFLKQSHIFKQLLPSIHREIIMMLYPRGNCQIYTVQFYGGDWCSYKGSAQFDTLDEAKIYFESYMPIESSGYTEINLEVFRTEQQIIDKVGDDSIECEIMGWTTDSESEEEDDSEEDI